MRRLIISTVPVVALAAVVTVAVSARPADSREDRPLTTIVDDWRERAGVAGVSVAIRRPDGEVVALTSGLADVEAGRLVAVGDRFHIGSITKTLVSAAVLRLVDRGVVGLDDRLGRWLDEPARSGDVTVRQLLAHTSGIPNYTEGTDFFDDLGGPHTPEQLVSLIARHEPSFPPGEGYRYSNTNYVLLGLLLEAVTGDPYEQVIADELARPLGTDDLGVGLAATAGGYYDLDHDGDVERTDTAIDLTAITHASGAAVASATDLAEFGAAVFGGGLLRPATITAMTDEVFTGSRYGLGVQRLVPDGRTRVVGHSGAVPGYLATLWWVPELEVSIAVLTNGSDAPSDDLAELLLRALLRGAPPGGASNPGAGTP